MDKLNEKIWGFIDKFPYHEVTTVDFFETRRASDFFITDYSKLINTVYPEEKYQVAKRGTVLDFQTAEKGKLKLENIKESSSSEDEKNRTSSEDSEKFEKTEESLAEKEETKNSLKTKVSISSSSSSESLLEQKGNSKNDKTKRQKDSMSSSSSSDDFADKKNEDKNEKTKKVRDSVSSSSSSNGNKNENFKNTSSPGLKSLPEKNHENLIGEKNSRPSSDNETPGHSGNIEKGIRAERRSSSSSSSSSGSGKEKRAEDKHITRTTGEEHAGLIEKTNFQNHEICTEKNSNERELKKPDFSIEKHSKSSSEESVKKQSKKSSSSSSSSDENEIEKPESPKNKPVSGCDGSLVSNQSSLPAETEKNSELKNPPQAETVHYNQNSLNISRSGSQAADSQPCCSKCFIV